MAFSPTRRISSIKAGANASVNATDPKNPEISFTGSITGGQVESVQAGTNITVDSTDPHNPVISATGSGGTSLIVPVITGYTPSKCDVGTSITSTLPNTMQEGDYIFAYAIARSAISGFDFSWFEGKTIDNGNLSQKTYCYYKLCETADIGATFTLSQTANDRIGIGFVSVSKGAVMGGISGALFTTSTAANLSIPVFSPSENTLRLCFCSSTIAATTAPTSQSFTGTMITNYLPLAGSLMYGYNFDADKVPRLSGHCRIVNPGTYNDVLDYANANVDMAIIFVSLTIN